jgi:hypothetical protein
MKCVLLHRFDELYKCEGVMKALTLLAANCYETVYVS